MLAESQNALLLHTLISALAALISIFIYRIMHISLSRACALAATMSMAVVACKPAGENPEDVATPMLGEARALLADGRYGAARDTIMSMRRRHPLALEARRQAILTLDSVELLETRDSMNRYEAELEAARAAFGRMLPRVGGRTNEDYYAQQRLVHDMEFHFEELCAKAKFFERKIDIDSRGGNNVTRP